MTHGTLKLTTPELVEPLAAEEFDMEVSYPSAPGTRLAWKLRLAKPTGGTSAETLGIDGDFDHQAPANPDLSLTIQGVHWPLALQTSGRSGTRQARRCSESCAHRFGLEHRLGEHDLAESRRAAGLRSRATNSPSTRSMPRGTCGKTRRG